jgi:hypothetical protein
MLKTYKNETSVRQVIYDIKMEPIEVAPGQTVEYDAGPLDWPIHSHESDPQGGMLNPAAIIGGVGGGNGGLVVHTHESDPEGGVLSGYMSADAIPIYGQTVTCGKSGAVQFNTIAAAYAYAKTLSPSVTNRILIKVFPGLYLQAATLVFDTPYIDIEGSGETITEVRNSVDLVYLVNASGNPTNWSMITRKIKFSVIYVAENANRTCWYNFNGGKKIYDKVSLSCQGGGNPAHYSCALYGEAGILNDCDIYSTGIGCLGRTLIACCFAKFYDGRIENAMASLGDSIVIYSTDDAEFYNIKIKSVSYQSDYISKGSAQTGDGSNRRLVFDGCHLKSAVTDSATGARGIDLGEQMEGIKVTRTHIEITNGDYAFEDIGKIFIAGVTSNKPLFRDAATVTYGHLSVPLLVPKSGATQGAAGATAGELWKTNGHLTLPDNVIMIGV